MTARPIWLEVSDGRIEAAWWGTGERVIVLLHEGLGCVALWRDLPRQLAERLDCRVFAYSRFGYGQSDPRVLPWQLDYLHDEALRVLPQVLRAAGITRATIVGHSDGGSIAAIYAGSATDPVVEALVMIAPHFFVEASGLAAVHAIGGDYFRGELRERLARYHRNVDVAFHGWYDSWTDLNFTGLDLTAALRGIRVPTLALQGADDAYGTAAQLNAVTQYVPRPTQTLMIQGARHAPHLESQDETLTAIVAFLRTEAWDGR